ncbi:glutathione-dependent formaldehyde-activating enzyme [Thecamonas trahens ATCC 50062]|uniref:Glutathione-dependent formaldehyde-activating enzyme n=1 Tax=Thecamonas trahens ATCC 50062 TaxID=461836 RepID=A0A0L0D240_THETB|nr:glutathione-dependent formaldehyde-activating enzyme [Thecamonas trahens ATCC 50062]KNC46347.1 glutathione-dependent formaldehyde-activating enzyme [Thecamonas trahens ATCC 50062]|eukprot:XP_013760640.1 glutathione-dependent formaldehyde-activating enzyme [Thecamonas trahens ATCC 50062]
MAAHDDEVTGGAEVTLSGGCHCGALRFRIAVELSEEGGVPAAECNCTMCSKKGFLHIIVPDAVMHREEEEGALGTYTFNTHTAKHHFCTRCGTCPYYVPRSNPDGWSVNARCLDLFTTGIDFSKLTITRIDGQNWESAVGDSLAHLSRVPAAASSSSTSAVMDDSA